jgi:membrane-associated phospholipid phosphatase
MPVSYFGWNCFEKIIYLLSILLVIIWIIGVPFSRYLVGVHSLEQIILGSILGAINGLTHHYLIRDHLLIYVQTIMRY